MRERERERERGNQEIEEKKCAFEKNGIDADCDEVSS
jgi:hypothetical protein